MNTTTPASRGPLARASFTALLGLAATLLILPPARATTILRPFTGATTGGTPDGSLTLSGSKLYGMTSAGGFNSNGVVFSFNTDGTGYARLHSFPGGASDGSQPHGSLTLSGSTLYGMTNLGGSSNRGTIFSMNTDGTGFALLHSLSSGSGGGSYPKGSLTLSGSKLFGMTSGGGGATTTLFSLNTDGTGFGALHYFTGLANDGVYPEGSLTLSGSTLYGMTSAGGAENQGTVFSMNTDGTGFSLLHSFPIIGDCRNPRGSLTLSGSKLFGMTVGGLNGKGGVFSINTDGTGYGLIHTFTGGTGDGGYPYGSLTLLGSKLYGMTDGGGSANSGTIFSMNTDGTGFALLDSFGVSPADGAAPVGDLTVSDDGSMLYGMTSAGGVNSAGVIFSKSIAPEPGSAALALLGGLGLLAHRRRASAH